MAHRPGLESCYCPLALKLGSVVPTKLREIIGSFLLQVHYRKGFAQLALVEALVHSESYS